MHYKEVMREIQDYLDAHGGRASTQELAEAIGVDAAQIRKCAGYLGHITEGTGMYQPAIVIDWHTLSFDELPPEDKWLVRMFEKTGAEAINSARLKAVAQAAGYSKAAMDRALFRQGCTSVMINGKWHRRAPGSSDEPLTPSMSDDEAVAALAKAETPVVTDPKTEARDWINNHRMLTQWVCEILAKRADEAIEDNEDRTTIGYAMLVVDIAAEARAAKRPLTDDVPKAVAELITVGYVAANAELVSITDAGLKWVGK